MFRWIQDEEGDVGLSVLGLVTFVKYKGYTIVRLGGRRFNDALKYLK